MALPTTIVSSATTTWSDHKNQNHGGAQRVTFYTDSSDNGTFYNLGDTHQYCGIVTTYSGQANHKLVRVRFFLQRVGSPTGNVFVQVRPNASPTGTTHEPSFTTLWGTSNSFPVSSIPTSGKNEVVFSFAVPVALPVADTTSFAIVLTISAQGDASNYVKVYKGVNGDVGGSRNYGSSTWDNTLGTSISPSKVIEISKSGARVFALDKSGNALKPYITNTNTGASFSAEANTGSINSGANLKSANSQSSINDLGASYVAAHTASANSLGIYRRSEVAGMPLDPNAVISFGTFNTNVSGSAPIFGGRRTNGTAVIVAQKATETVMGTARRRIGLSFYNGSTWSSVFDVVGSANTPDATLPGDANHHDLRWAGLDPNGDFHIVYSKSDTSTLQYRKFTSANVFTTINTLNGAVASATANYPVGLGAFLYASSDWYVAIPYVDNTSNTLKEARAKTTISETSSNWTITQIVAASAEVSGSNPAVLIADNLQGSKLVCFRVKPTTKGLAMTHDGGTGVWATETDWRGGAQTCGGISGVYTEDGIGLVYLEESTTPDEIRYDHL